MKKLERRSCIREKNGNMLTTDGKGDGRRSKGWEEKEKMPGKRKGEK